MTTAGQRRSQVTLRMLALTALDVCDVLAERGEEHDDRPRLYLSAIVGWSRGEVTGAQLGAALRAHNGAMAARRWGLAEDEVRPVVRAWDTALMWLADARVDLYDHPTHRHHEGRVLAYLAEVVAAVTGDPIDAAKSRVDVMIRAHAKSEAAPVKTQRAAGVVAPVAVTSDSGPLFGGAR